MRTPPAGTTPEELETLMEDAIVLHDGLGLSRLFERSGLLVLESGAVPLHGQKEIEQAVERVAALKGGYIAGPRRLYQNRDLVLLIGDGVINVARRGRDGSWRFVISLLDPGMGRVDGKSTGVGSSERA